MYNIDLCTGITDTCNFFVFRVVSAEGPLFSQPVYHVSVAEDTALGTAITRVVAESPSGSLLVYTVVSGDPSRIFSLDYSTGK